MNRRILIEEDFFFFGHIRCFHDLETCRTLVFLRPKRFGKSLWASMLEHCYDVHFSTIEVVIDDVGGNRGCDWFDVQGVV